MEQLRTQARLLSNDIVRLAAKVKKLKAAWIGVGTPWCEISTSSSAQLKIFSMPSRLCLSTERFNHHSERFAGRVSRVSSIAQLGWRPISSELAGDAGQKQPDQR